MVCDEDRIDYLVNFYSKSNRLSMSIFTVIVIDLVAKSQVKNGGGEAEGPGKDVVAATSSPNDIRRSEKAKVLEKA